MAGPRWLSEDELRSWRSLQMMHMRLTARLARDLAAHSGLSYQDYVVLVALTDQPNGSVRLFELAAWLGWEKSRLSHQVSRMVERGLVRKHGCASDRRGAIVEVSAQGRAELAQAAPSHADAVRRLFVDLLSPAELAELGRLSERVLQAVENEERDFCGPEHRCCPGEEGESPGDDKGR